MATERTTAEINALLADNTGGDISPQDIRDAFATSHGGYAGLILSIAGAPATLPVSTSPAVITQYNIRSAQSVDTNTGGCSADPATGIITVGQTGIYKVGFFCSSSIDANNRLGRFTPHINGSVGLVDVERAFSNANDIGSISFHGIIPYTAGDQIDIRVALDTGTATMSFVSLGFHLHRIG